MPSMNVPPRVPAGFIKTGTQTAPKLSPEERAGLIRKGNESFNMGKYELSERIFITCRYQDGLARLGDVYFKKQEYRKAVNMYMLSKDQGRIERVSRRIALVVRQWLLEDQGSNKKEEKDQEEPQGES